MDFVRVIEWNTVEKVLLPPSFLVRFSCQFHVGEVVSSLRRTTLVPGGAEVLLYTTINGSIGALLPFKSRWVPLGGRASFPRHKDVGLILYTSFSY